MKRLFLLLFTISQLIFLQPVFSQNQQSRDAIKLYKEGRYDEGIQVAMDEIQKSPKNADSYIALGWCLLAEKRYEEAIEWTNKILETSPTNLSLIEIIGEANYYLENYDEAMKWFENYLKIDDFSLKSTTADVYYFMGNIYVSTGQLHKAEVCLNTYVSLKSPFDSTMSIDTRDKLEDVFLLLAYIEERLNNKDTALEYYRQALILNTSSKEAQYGIIRLEN